MRKPIQIVILATLAILAGAGLAWAAQPKPDVFQGKLFPPAVILQHQDELALSEDQFEAIRTAVVAVQADVAEHEWDLREAYRNVLAELDKTPVDEARVMEFVDKALVAENNVKKAQVGMLLRVRNLLTDEQVAFLKAEHAAKGVD